jgi:hypothetical protein
MTDDLYHPERLTLRVKHRNFLDALRSHGVPDEQLPVTAPLCGELLLSYAFEQPAQFVMATPPLLARAGVTPADCRALALANFKGRFSAQLVRTGLHEGLIAVRTGGDLEAVVLAFDGFWQHHMSSEIGHDTCVCAPRRDVLLIAKLSLPGALEALRAEAARLFHATTDTHALSLQLMQWTPTGWRLAQSTPAELA